MLERVAIDVAVGLARELIADLQARRSAGLAAAAPQIDEKLERRIVLELGGDQLKDLAERRRAAESAAKRAREQAVPRNSTANFASARTYETAQRQDADIKRATQRARQAKAKFQVVYAGIIASDAFSRRVQAEIAAADPAYAKVVVLDNAIHGLQAVIDSWLTEKAGGKSTVEIDVWMLRDMDAQDAARRLVALAGESEAA
ncbi:MAG: hypothetical protein P1U88_21570 [Thalassobaculaceae bacterium]|nr:hypothetical protein [Thalassobaculaceae bacterium]